MTDTAAPEAPATGHERPPRRHDDAPHPWWGDPPHLEEARRWIRIVGQAIQAVQTEIAAARVGDPVAHDDGRPVAPDETDAYVRAKVRRRASYEGRLRWLRGWAAAVEGGAALTDQTPASVAVMHAACRRLVLLEGVMGAAQDLLGEHPDVEWLAGGPELQRAVEAVQANGLRP